MADQAAVEDWLLQLHIHHTAVHPQVRINTERAAARMVAASVRKYGKLKPEFLDVGDAVRVSFLALPSVQALVKSGILGEPAPLFSPKLYKVQHVHNHGTFCTYDVSTSEPGDNEVFISSRSVTMASELVNVPRHLLLYQPHSTPHMALGRRYPTYIDAALLNAQ